MINYESYLERRGWGLRAVEAYNATIESEGEADLLKGLISMVVGVVVYSVVQEACDGITGENVWGGLIWIESPTYQSIKQVPLRLAIRIIRKRGWHYAEVEPVNGSCESQHKEG